MSDDTLYKPGYEGERLSSATTLPERQTMRLGKPDLLRRLFDAMLTLTVVEGGSQLAGLKAGATPPHLVEFSDRVGEEKQEPARPLFRPTAAQVSDMDGALALLEGLRPAYFRVVMLRAIHHFERQCGEPGSWTWANIGGSLGMSASWAERAFDLAITQAARRSGLLPRVTTDHALFVAGVWTAGGWMSNIGTGSEPRQAVANLKGKSPLRIESAFAIWVPGQPVAKRAFEEARKRLRSLSSHSAWYKANPDTVCAELAEICRDIGAGWMIEDIPLKGTGDRAV